MIIAQIALVFWGGIARGDRPEPAGQFVTLQSLLSTATIVVFVIWFRRCRLNAQAYAPGAHKYTSGYAVGGWFIPVAMWWIPRRITVDVWRASGLAGTWPVNVWWVAWLAKWAAVVATPYLSVDWTAFSPLIQVTNLVAAVLAVLMIQRLSAAQAEKYRADKDHAAQAFRRRSPFDAA
ncbi:MULTISPECIES: DUF4328 domain-containing protein [unclassified Kitasatospora]|uniref:DUF4328 domain-containing protein n=1 Tax=unclassified Kitasatospora TaxID=2633591 RepID=UPI0024744A5A|nr:DUF4328 domain-containing protein [Kitasatospora sp. MAP12-44]